MDEYGCPILAAECSGVAVRRRNGPEAAAPPGSGAGDYRGAAAAARRFIPPLHYCHPPTRLTTTFRVDGCPVRPRYAATPRFVSRATASPSRVIPASATDLLD